jgi:hypothetical protein
MEPNEGKAMFEDIVNTMVKDDELPLQHKFGKLMVGTIAGFIATELAKKAYMAVLIAWNQK